MRGYHPDHVAQVAATLLAGKHDAEPHHVKAAIKTAHLLLDEAYVDDEARAESDEPAEGLKAGDETDN